MSEEGLTDEGDKDEDDVECQAGAGAGEEECDGADGDDDGGDGDGGEQLEGDYRVHLPYEGPPKFGALQHHRVQWPRPALQIRFPERLVPHLRKIVRRFRAFSFFLCFPGKVD